MKLFYLPNGTDIVVSKIEFVTAIETPFPTEYVFAIHMQSGTKHIVSHKDSGVITGCRSDLISFMNSEH